MRKFLDNDKINYICNLFAKENKLLYQINQEIKDSTKVINISAEEGKLLQLIIKLCKAEKILEIGTFYGYSTLWMAMANPNCKIYTIEKDKDNAAIARKNFSKSNYKNQIELIEGDAITKLDELNELAPFDFIFIDANKSKYINYFKWAESNLKIGGIIAIDNTLLAGAVYKKEFMQPKYKLASKMRMFNEYVANNDNFSSIIIPTEEGMTLAFKIS